MSISLVNQLCSIRDVLDERDEPICAAQLQLVIDTLSQRPAFAREGRRSGRQPG